MDEFEKVEKLRQRANVTYEEAREALKESDGDLLDAMVYLEKQGKVDAPKESTHSTEYEKQSQYKDVKETVSGQEKKEEKRSFGQKFKHFIQIVCKKLQENSLHIEHKDVEVVSLPLWAVLLVLLFTWHVVWILILVSLFFDCHYHLEGKDNMDSANDVMEKASAAAEHVKDEFEKL